MNISFFFPLSLTFCHTQLKNKRFYWEEIASSTLGVWAKAEPLV